MEKMTNVKALEYVLSHCELTTEVKEKIAKIKASYEKKSTATGEKKPTATQVANEGIKTAIVEGMEANRNYTVTELQKEIPACAELSNQRVSALLRQLKEEGKVVRIEDKRKAYFSKA